MYVVCMCVCCVVCVYMCVVCMCVCVVCMCVVCMCVCACVCMCVCPGCSCLSLPGLLYRLPSHTESEAAGCMVLSHPQGKATTGTERGG